MTAAAKSEYKTRAEVLRYLSGQRCGPAGEAAEAAGLVRRVWSYDRKLYVVQPYNRLDYSAPVEVWTLTTAGLSITEVRHG